MIRKKKNSAGAARVTNDSTKFKQNDLFKVWAQQLNRSSKSPKKNQESTKIKQCLLNKDL
jgi:hypothetical protein